MRFRDLLFLPVLLFLPLTGVTEEKKEWADFNFDGHRDYRIKVAEDGRADRYDVFLFRPESGGFEKCESLSDRINPWPHPGDETVRCHWSGGHSGALYTEDVYRWKDGRAILHEVIRQSVLDLEPGGLRYLRVTVRLIDGKPVVSAIEDVTESALEGGK